MGRATGDTIATAATAAATAQTTADAAAASASAANSAVSDLATQVENLELTGLGATSAQLYDAIGELMERVIVLAEGAIALLPQLDSVRTAVHTESFVRSTEDEALALRLDVVEAVSGDAAAAVAVETAARAAGDTAIAAQVTTASSRIDGTEASIVEILGSAGGTATHWGVTANAAGAVLGLVRLDGDASGSTFKVLADHFVIANPSGSGEVTAFEVNLVNGTPQVGIRGDLIIDGSINGVSVGQNTLDWTNLNTAPGTMMQTVFTGWQDDTDEAFEQAQQAAEGALSGLALTQQQNASIRVAQQVVADETVSLANQIEVIAASLGSTAALVTAEQTARSDGDTALASSISSVSTQVASNTAGIVQVMGSSGGTATHWAVTTNAQGQVTGMVRLDGATTGSTFTVVADKFVVAHPSAPGTTIQAFVIGLVNGVSTVGINGNLLVDGTILARHIGADQITGNHIQASTIEAIHLDVGTLDAVSATIGVLRTATSGARMEIRDNVIKVFDSSGQIRVQIGDLAL